MNNIILSNLKSIHLVLQLFAWYRNILSVLQFICQHYWRTVRGPSEQETWEREWQRRRDRAVNFLISWNSQTILASRALPLREWTRTFDSLRRPALVHFLRRRMEKCKNANKTALRKNQKRCTLITFRCAPALVRPSCSDSHWGRSSFYRLMDTTSASRWITRNVLGGLINGL